MSYTPARDHGQYCRHCGSGMPPGSHFCPSCGRDADRRTSSPWITVAAAVVVLLVAATGTWLLIDRRGGPTPSAQPSRSSLTTTPTTAPSSAPATSTPSTTKAQTSFADLYRSVNSGVVRIGASTCDGGGIGTGFLVDSRHVATAAHVVDGAAALSLSFGDGGSGGYASAVVVGIDHDTDMALLKTDHAVEGHLFSLSPKSPTVGQEVAAIGFPVDEPMTMTRGSVSGLNRSIDIDGVVRSGLIQTDTAVNPGNSGGPLLALDGKVYGIVDAKRMDAEGIAYAVSPETGARNLKAWHGRSKSVVSAPCDAPVAPPEAQDPDVQAPTGADPSVVDFFDQYFTAINSADYDTVWKLMSPRIRGASPDSLANGLSTTYDFEVVVHSSTSKDKGRQLAHVSFTSVQSAEKGPDGDLCDEWDLDYLLEPLGSSWRIYAVSGYQNGPTHETC